MDEIRDRLLEEFHDRETRTEYADEFLDALIALQIAALRRERGMTQKKLGELAGGMKQSRISAYEKVDYSSWSVRTLRRLARALDLPLVVSFESWGDFLDRVTKLSHEDLDRPPFEKDPVFNPSVASADSPSPQASYDATDNVVEFPGAPAPGAIARAAPASSTITKWKPPARTASAGEQ